MSLEAADAACACTLWPEEQERDRGLLLRAHTCCQAAPTQHPPTIHHPHPCTHTPTGLLAVQGLRPRPCGSPGGGGPGVQPHAPAHLQVGVALPGSFHMGVIPPMPCPSHLQVGHSAPPSQLNARRTVEQRILCVGIKSPMPYLCSSVPSLHMSHCAVGAVARAVSMPWISLMCTVCVFSRPAAGGSCPGTSHSLQLGTSTITAGTGCTRK